MINKIKDFLKNKLPRFKRNQSDQDENFADQIPAKEKSSEIDFFQTDNTGSFQVEESIQETLDDEPRTGFKDKLQHVFSSTKAKYNARRLKPLTVPKEGNEKVSSFSAKLKQALLSPSVGKNIELILGQSSREQIHQIFLVTMICAVTYSLGKISALALKGKPALDSAKDFVVDIPFERDFNASTLAQVKRTNVFKTNTGLGKKTNVADTKCEKSQGVSSLPIKLVNTVVLQDTIKSIASVQVRSDRGLQEVREGEQISNLAKIFRIDRLELLVKNLESGACESIVSSKLDERNKGNVSVMSPAESRAFRKNKQMPGIENSGNNFKISKALLDTKMKDIASILTQAKAIKIQNPDGSIAFKMTEMDPEGIFPYLGLQDQDTITSINGKPIYDMNEVMSLFARIKNLENLSLGIKREGADTVQEYNIKK